MSNDERLTWDLITGVLDVLEKHGHHHADDRHTGRAIGLIGDLARIYEGTQEGPARAYPVPMPEPGQPGSPEAIAAAGMSTILLALDQASDYKRERAACCADCEDQSCGSCQFRLEAAQAYDSLAARLHQASNAVTPDRPSRPTVPGRESGAVGQCQGPSEREAGS